jgi:competence protein CoiA
MPLYASDGQNFIYAPDAIQGIAYRCIECKSLLKIRRGKHRIAHFYHIQTSPSCRLYSKSEDHLLVQLQIQKMFDKEELKMEAPFLEIHRVADLLWEKGKIIFEIQCSSIRLKEVENRIKDYRKMGYEIVWLLDDRLFNRKIPRPSEAFLRSHICYFFHFQRERPSFFYDQLECITEKKRLKSKRQLKVDLKQPHPIPQIEWPSFTPQQLHLRIEQNRFYFKGDLIDRMIQSAISSFFSLTLQNWKNIETRWLEQQKPESQIHAFVKKQVVRPYIEWLEGLLSQMT